MDLRKRKSQQKLQDALAEHLKEKALEDITIGELTQSAGVSRQTFYSNFDSKQAVLVGRVERILESVGEYFKSIATDSNLSRNEVVELGVKKLLEVCQHQRTLMTAAFTGQAGNMCMQMVKRYVAEFIHQRILLMFRHTFLPDELDIISDFYAGAFMGTIQGYLASPEGSKSIDQIAKEVSLLMPHGLDGVISKEV
jgi:AcrR family transcriptional regulator